MPMPAYPDGPRARDRFVTSLRPPKPVHDPWRAHGVLVEDEPVESGRVTRVATVFLTGRECPWRCAMCDLWQHTTDTATPPGAIASQTMHAVRELDKTPGVTRIKLYNAGSFFDPLAVPPGDYEAVAEATRAFDRVIVESHPSLVGPRTRTFIDALDRASWADTGGGPSVGGGDTGVAPYVTGDAAGASRLEVAMGLETAHPVALDRIHKRMTLADFARAADTLATMRVALRVFLLISPPFVPPGSQDAWLARSVDTAFGAGAAVVSLIPTRHGNGAMDVLRADGEFRSPTLDDVERSFALALDRSRPAGARVLVDLWDLARFASCPDCLDARRARLHTMNLDQRVLPPVTCSPCDERPSR